MKTPECDGFRAELARALERGEAQPLSTHGHLFSCRACRSRLEEETALDALLLSWPRVALPAHLARRVLSRLARERAEARLDDLLGRVPEPVPPRDLGPRVLADLAARRAPARPWLAVAAVLLVCLGGALLFRRVFFPASPERNGLVVEAEPEPELLEALEVLENWEVVTSDDLDLLLAELDPIEWTLLELGADTGG